MPNRHYTSSDEEGNIREMPRRESGQLEHQPHELPFPAIVTAWYSKSQTIDVNIPTRFGQTVINAVQVYGNFFQATGTIQGPKIAVTLGKDGYSTVREPEQINPASSKYVLDNNIEALVFKTSVGYAASSFRFLTSDSPMLNNVKPGRKITRHDDGSYFIHDDDGNMQFKHPSGLNIRAGDSVDDIELEEDFPDHAKNKLAYATGITAEITVPSVVGDHKVTFDPTGKITILHATGAKMEMDIVGLFEFTGATGKNLKTILDAFIDAVGAIIVTIGTPANPVTLALLKADLALLLK